MGLGVWEIAVILVIVLIIFGAGKLPKVMGDLGQGIRNFKQGINTPDPTLPSADDPAAQRPESLGSPGPTKA